ILMYTSQHLTIVVLLSNKLLKVMVHGQSLNATVKQIVCTKIYFNTNFTRSAFIAGFFVIKKHVIKEKRLRLVTTSLLYPYNRVPKQTNYVKERKSPNLC